MKFSRRLEFISLSALVLVVLACSAIAGPLTSSTPAGSSPAGIPVLAAPIQFVIPDGLAGTATVASIAVVTDQTGAPWDIAPAHVEITLEGYALQNSFHVPQIFVYPGADYAAANSSAAESLKRLQAVLAAPNKPYTNDVLPYVPFFNAGQVIASQEKVIQFKGGSGLRILTQYAQDVSPINNGGLFYHFEGLSSDGKYYIVAILPTTAPFLAADNNPDSAVPPGGIPFPQNTAPSTSFETYFTQVTDMLNNTSAVKFNPSIDMLDALIQSISIQQ